MPCRIAESSSTTSTRLQSIVLIELVVAFRRLFANRARHNYIQGIRGGVLLCLLCDKSGAVRVQSIYAVAEFLPLGELGFDVLFALIEGHFPHFGRKFGLLDGLDLKVARFAGVHEVPRCIAIVRAGFRQGALDRTAS